MNDAVRRIAEDCSNARPRIHELALLELRPYVEDWLDGSWLNAKLSEYENWASSNSDPLLQRNLLHRPLGFNMLAAAIWAARSWEAIYKGDPSFRPPGGAKRLINIACSLAVVELHAGHQLDSNTREYVRQRLQAADELWGLVHEANTFSYFIQKGAQVDPGFLKKASPQEIIVHWQGQEIPVQCKAKKPGAGRLISQGSFTTLAGAISRDAKAAGRRLLVRMGSTGPIRQQDIDFLCYQVANGVGSDMGPALVTNQGRTFSIKTEPLSGQFTRDTVRDYLSSFDFHVGMVIGEPTLDGEGYSVDVVVGIDANPNENRRAWRSLYDSITDGARQLEGGPPGIVAIHYADPVSDFEVLRPGSEPMILVMARLQEPLSHLGAVMLSSEPDLQLPGSGRPGTVHSYVKEAHLPASLLGEPV